MTGGNGIAATIARIPLFDGVEEGELELLGSLMVRFEVPAGSTLYEEGEQSDRLYVVERGELEATNLLPGGERLRLATFGPGDVIGETSLLDGGLRSATVTSSGGAEGWSLDRRSVDLLRDDPRPEAVALTARLGRLALERLRTRYRLAEARMEVESGPGAASANGGGVRPGTNTEPLSYLAGLLCFRHFHSQELVRTAVDGCEWLEAQRGAIVIAEGEQPDALYLVVRGAVETAMRRPGALHRLRLAGPGHFVGHIGAVESERSPVECRARERAVLLAMPSARVQQALTSGATADRALTRSISEDMARALRQADHPVARMASASV